MPSDKAWAVFLIDEVLRTILQNVQGSQRSDPFHTLKSLLACALTCQTSKEPALDQLWENIPDFECLLRAIGLLDISDASSWVSHNIRFVLLCDPALIDNAFSATASGLSQMIGYASTTTQQESSP